MRPFSRARSFLTLALVPLLAPVLQAAQITLPSSADTGLFEASPLNNIGRTPHVAAGTTGLGQFSRALFRFDIAGSIPDGATVTAVTVSLRVVRQPSSGGPSSTFRLHRLLQDWGEGNKTTLNHGSAASSGESSWIMRLAPTTPWAAPGGQAGTDYVSAPSSTRLISGVATYTFPSTPALIADIQTWLDNPGNNFGWILITQSEDSDATGRRFATREDLIASNRPALTITYQLPPMLVNPAFDGQEFSFQFEGQAGKSYLAQGRAAFDPADPWTTFLTIPALAQAGTVTVMESITSGPRFFRIIEQ